MTIMTGQPTGHQPTVSAVITLALLLLLTDAIYHDTWHLLSCAYKSQKNPLPAACLSFAGCISNNPCSPAAAPFLLQAASVLATGSAHVPAHPLDQDPAHLAGSACKHTAVRSQI